ncbi:MAG: C2 family cysteine protease [Myxococcaceae bacterium]
MPLNINDRKLASLYTALETKRKTDSSVQVDDKKVLELLAAVGDSLSKSGSKLLTELSAPGITREQQVALIQKGMSAGEKKDLATILESGTVPVSPTAKNFLEAVLGRQTILPGSALQITGDQKNGIAGIVKPGATIEAINITTAPGGRLHMDDTMEIAKADSSGKFIGKLPDVQEGDLIRIRARAPDGTTSDWVTIHATGIAAKDTRNAVVSMQRIGLTADQSGKVAVTNINEGRQVSEPGAKLQFTNTRTNEKTLVTLDEKGSFPDGFKVNGKPGDVFSVAATDGTNNTTFAAEVGRLTVPGGTGGGDLIKDPALHKDELNPDGTPRFGKKTFTGPLFIDGVKSEDVAQGQLGDCFFPSAMAALAKNNPEAIQNLIKSNGDGTYTVTFHEKDWATGKFRDVPIKVDGDLYVRSWGAPLYGSSNNADKGDKTMELWFPLVEKAYATWKGSYNDIGNGGMSSDVFEAVLAKSGQDMTITSSNQDKVWAQLTKAIDSKLPVSAGTYGDDQEAKYSNTGVYADHSYSVLGYEVKNGEKYVTLRNPWGESEPAGNGANDGIFNLKLSEFTNLYQTLMWAQ